MEMKTLELRHDESFGIVTVPSSDSPASGSGDLGVVMIRLLAIAVSVAACQVAVRRSRVLSQPADYTTWPMLEMETQRGPGRCVLKLYVDPEGAATKDNQAFPGGTVFVMETYAVRAPRRRNLIQVFRMTRGGNSRSLCLCDPDEEVEWTCSIGEHASVDRLRSKTYTYMS
ncbi:MAG: hypothetical protein HZA21_05315 [Nitrospirae bacterium]|nr:hypothetical protein [Nitrospirota bacterium]